MEKSIIEQLKERKEKAIELLQRTKIAVKYLPKNFDLSDFVRDYKAEELTGEKLERAFFDCASEAYWSYKLMEEDRDIISTEIFIEDHVINSEYELEEWEQALTERYEPVAWYYARRQNDKQVYIVALSQVQLDWAEVHGVEDACEMKLKHSHIIDASDRIDAVSQRMESNPFPRKEQK